MTETGLSAAIYHGCDFNNGESLSGSMPQSDKVI